MGAHIVAEHRAPRASGARGDAMSPVTRCLVRPDTYRDSVVLMLVAAELALAFTVLIGAGLLTKSFARVTAIDPGFSIDHRLTVRVSLPLARYPAAPQRMAFYTQLFDRLSALPGVQAAGGVSELPFSDMRNMGTFEIEGRTLSRGTDLPHADWRSASPGYFSAMNVGLVAGRFFEFRDAGDAPLHHRIEARPFSSA
jgi:hypothetical protein